MELNYLLTVREFFFKGLKFTGLNLNFFLSSDQLYIAGGAIAISHCHSIRLLPAVQQDFDEHNDCSMGDTCDHQEFEVKGYLGVNTGCQV